MLTVSHFLVGLYHTVSFVSSGVTVFVGTTTFGVLGSTAVVEAGWVVFVAPAYRAMACMAGTFVLTLPPETVTVLEQSCVPYTLQYSPSGSVVV